MAQPSTAATAMIDRRAFLSGLAVAAVGTPFIAAAQLTARMPTLGLLYPSPSSGPQGTTFDFVSGRLSDLGWFVGKTIAIEDASAEGREDRLPVLAQALVAKGVDVIWVAGPEAALAAAQATKTIPIVFYGVGYPVEQGLVESLSRPAGNVTGLASIAAAEITKTLEVLREIIPGRTRLASIATSSVLRTVSGHELRVGLPDVDSAAAKLGFEVRRYFVSKREDLDATFASILDARAEAILVGFTALTFRERQHIVDFASRGRLPSAFYAKEFVQAGGLVSYGANRSWMIRHSFVYVDRVLRGAPPADLPVELPRQFELTLNMKTAQTLGLTIPPSLLARADQVIE